MSPRGPLAGLLAAHAVSMTGNVLTLIALPLHVLTTTGSPALMGVTGVFATLPVVVGGTFGGVLVDRLGPRRASVLADVVSGATIALVPVLDATAGLPFPVLLALVFVSGVLDSPGQTARTAVLPEVAALAGVPLERAAAWLEATERGARMLGAPLAGLGVALLLAGVAVEHAGLRPTLVAAGTAYVVVTLAPLLGGPWRGLDRAPAGVGAPFTARS